MGSIEQEDRKYWEDVEAVKKWWQEPRWRHTKRPFTAEQIVAKRGNLKIEYPSNVQSKKLWELVEWRFKVSSSSFATYLQSRFPTLDLRMLIERRFYVE